MRMVILLSYPNNIIQKMKKIINKVMILGDSTYPQIFKPRVGHSAIGRSPLA
jgi:hypothetical protein